MTNTSRNDSTNQKETDVTEKTNDPIPYDQRLRYAMKLIGILDGAKRHAQFARDVYAKAAWAARDVNGSVEQVLKEIESDELKDVLTPEERQSVRWDAERVVKDLKPLLEAFFGKEG